VAKIYIMAQEFLVKYLNGKTLEEFEIESISNSLSNYSIDEFKIVFLKKEDGLFEFGFKINIIPEHDWIWDGYIFLNKIESTVQFNVATSQQIEQFCLVLKKIFLSNNIFISFEEE
jgi:hypothetical protein